MSRRTVTPQQATALPASKFRNYTFRSPPEQRPPGDRRTGWHGTLHRFPLLDQHHPIGRGPLALLGRGRREQWDRMEFDSEVTLAALGSASTVNGGTLAIDYAGIPGPSDPGWIVIP